MAYYKTKQEHIEKLQSQVKELERENRAMGRNLQAIAEELLPKKQPYDRLPDFDLIEVIKAICSLREEARRGELLLDALYFERDRLRDELSEANKRATQFSFAGSIVQKGFDIANGVSTSVPKL